MIKISNIKKENLNNGYSIQDHILKIKNILDFKDQNNLQEVFRLRSLWVNTDEWI